MSDYESLKKDLLRRGRLFEDPDFPATASSIGKKSDVDPAIVWQRPSEITINPIFIDDNATRFDLDQGDLGDCWFISGAACMAVANRKLFERCVPQDQSFTDGYAGIFVFNFWHFDTWEEVVVDDRLPTKNGRLMFAHNREQPNEFWAALLEKAYAKLYGNYENIDGGHIHDALVDFTGGISEVISLTDPDKLPYNLFEVMYRTLQMNSMVGCSIGTSSLREEDLGNGLFAGHAYSITNMIKTKAGSKTVELIRLRNPWGRGEWKGPWSDGSPEWKAVSDETKKKKVPTIKDDGEFWMDFNDWKREFERCGLCHLYPDGHTEEVAKDLERRSWAVNTYHDNWIRGINAGGCGNPPYSALFWSNPQYGLTLKDKDDEDRDGKCTMVVSLMQKAEALEFEELYISFYIYKLKPGRPILLDGTNYESDALFMAKQPVKFRNLREVTARYILPPGHYVIIPCTFEPFKQASFLLRVYTEQKADGSTIDTPTVIEPPAPTEDKLKAMFLKYSGGDAQMDAEELRNALNDLFKQEGSDGGYGVEMSRALLSVVDRNKSGFIDEYEFRKMMSEFEVWKGAFFSFDTDKSGTIDTYELSQVFKKIGFTLSRQVLSHVITRYGGKKKRLHLEDFIHCCSKILVLYGQFVKFKGSSGKAELNIEQWLATTLYY